MNYSSKIGLFLSLVYQRFHAKADQATPKAGKSGVDWSQAAAGTTGAATTASFLIGWLKNE